MSVYIKSRIHILDGRGVILCGKDRSSDSVEFDKVPSDAKICSKCLKKVGKAMLTDYVGLNSTTNKTLKTLLKEMQRGEAAGP